MAWCACAIFFAALYGLTVRTGQPGGDFALYILHAGNIVQGLPYAPTGFVPDAGNTIISPASYPPGYPLLLAPVYALAGMDLHAFQLLSSAVLLVLLALVYFLARPSLGPALAATVAISTGLMPDLFARRDLILSDIPFTAWCFAALVCCERVRHGARRGVTLCVALAGCVAMACATRSAGPVLVAAVALAALGRRGYRWRALLAASMSGMLAAAVAARLLHVDNSTYLGYFSHAHAFGIAAWLRETVSAYGPALPRALGLSFGVPINLAITCAFLVAVGAGWIVRIREDAGAPEAFLPLYLLLLVIFPVKLEPVRYLVPVAPLLLYYPAMAARRLLARHRAAVAPSCVSLCYALCFLPDYALHDPLTFAAPLVTDAPSQALYAAVRTRSGASSLVLSANPRVIVLMTGRRSAIWPAAPGAENFWSYVLRVHAAFAISDAIDINVSDRAAFDVLAASRGAAPAWRNARYCLWQLDLAKTLAASPEGGGAVPAPPNPPSIMERGSRR